MTTKGSGMILTRDLIRQAIKLAEPSALAILRHPEATWGPKVVLGVINVPRVETQPFSFDASGPGELWNPEWGQPGDFTSIAMAKRDLAMREKMSTSTIVACRPWCLQEGEFLYAGATYHSGIVVATSGAKGWADAAISEIIVSNIIMLAQLEKERRILEKMMEI